MVEFGERNYNMVSIKHAEFNYKCIVMSPFFITHSTRLLINNIRLDIIIPDDPREKKNPLYAWIVYQMELFRRFFHS